MKRLKIHYLQHVSFEGLGQIEEWAKINDHTLTATKFYNNEKLPKNQDFDFLIIMGGPMGVYDSDVYPWLVEEKEFIRVAIENNKFVLGICLGAQLIAAALGGRVYPNEVKEIGWFPITCKQSIFFNDLKDLIVFHWHGDTFDLPQGCENIAVSEACQNQAFVYHNNMVVGLQFHIEVNDTSVNQMIENGSTELIEANYIQSKSQILVNIHNCEKNINILFSLLNILTARSA